MLSHILLHCSDALCMKLRIYKGKHDKYCTSFTLFFNNLYCMNCIYNVVVVVVVIENKFQKKKKNLCRKDAVFGAPHISDFLKLPSSFSIICCLLGRPGCQACPLQDVVFPPLLIPHPPFLVACRIGIRLMPCLCCRLANMLNIRYVTH